MAYEHTNFWKRADISLTKITYWSWRKPSNVESRNNKLAGNTCFYKGVRYIIRESGGGTVLLKGINTRIIRSYITVYLPERKRKTIPELREELEAKYPGCTFSVPKVGCQLHGDIDAIFEYNGKREYIPWNY